MQFLLINSTLYAYKFLRIRPYGITEQTENFILHRTSGVSHFHTEEQERRFFHALCYAVGAEKALLQAALRKQF